MKLRGVTVLDWSGIDPSVFGTLFERALDEGKRKQLGTHYTSGADIDAIVEPVVFGPLRREWDDVRADVAARLKTNKSGDIKRRTQSSLISFSDCSMSRYLTLPAGPETFCTSFCGS